MLKQKHAETGHTRLLIQALTDDREDLRSLGTQRHQECTVHIADQL